MNTKNHQNKKLAFFLPNMFTALNMACGFGSLVLASQNRLFEATSILILGAIFDSVDGRVARMLGSQSSFGEQFDSLSDVVSFGVAPSFLIFQQSLSDFGRLGIVVSFVFMLCAALRLARFNANINKISSAYFQGLPSPGAALAIIGYVYACLAFSDFADLSFIAIPYTLLYGILMVTNIPFYSFKQSTWVKEHKRLSLALFFLWCGLVFSYYQVMFALGMLLYVTISLVNFSFRKREFGDVIEWSKD